MKKDQIIVIEKLSQSGIVPGSFDSIFIRDMLITATIRPDNQLTLKQSLVLNRLLRKYRSKCYSTFKKYWKKEPEIRSEYGCA